MSVVSASPRSGNTVIVQREESKAVDRNGRGWSLELVDDSILQQERDQTTECTNLHESPPVNRTEEHISSASSLTRTRTRLREAHHALVLKAQETR